MFNICLLLLISVSFSQNENFCTQIKSNQSFEYPPNSFFNLRMNDKNSIYIGNQLLFITFNDSIPIKENCSYFNFTGKYLTIETQESEPKNINLCNNTKSVDNIVNNICIYNFTTSFGEIILIENEILSYLMVFFGFLIILYGSGHFLLAIMIHFTIFLFFFLKDLIELSKGFSTFLIPSFLLIGSFISGVLITIYLREYNKNNLKYKILKIIYGLIFGYFLFKTIIYYIIIFTSSNTAVYSILLFMFTILGGGIGYIVTIFDNLNFYFFISCSTIPGSFYIIRGVGYIVGGYYSDIIKTNLSKEINLSFDWEGKGQILMYFFLHIFVIIISVISQIIYIKFKDNYIEKTTSQISSKNVSARTSLLNKNISKIATTNDMTEYSEFNDITNKYTNATIINASNNNSNESINDNSNNIYDQED